MGNTIRRISLAKPTDLTVLGLNRFKGMYCNAGVNQLSIDENGYVAPAVCFRKWKKKETCIFTDAFVFHPAPVVCPFDRCGCASDLLIPKYRKGFDTLPDAQRQLPLAVGVNDPKPENGFEERKDGGQGNPYERFLASL